MAKAGWRATVLTLFPEMFPGPLGASLAGKSLKEGIWSLKTLDIRQFARDKHRTVDDVPLGGGIGMVLKPDVVAAALDEVSAAPGPRIYLTPRGRPLDQPLARQLAEGDGAVFLCGRYEGVDQRVIDAAQMLEVSIGDYILSGGEMAALTVLDAVVRPDHRIQYRQCRHFAARQNVVPDADFQHLRRVDHALVDTLIAPTQKYRTITFGKLPRQRLVQWPTPRGQVDSGAGSCADLVQCRRHDIGLQHHADAAPERHVIDSPVLIARKLPNVQRFQRPDALLQGFPGKRCPKRSRKHLREQRQNRRPPACLSHLCRPPAANRPPSPSPATRRAAQSRHARLPGQSAEHSPDRRATSPRVPFQV